MDSPYYFSIERDRTTVGSGSINMVLYVPESAFSLDCYTQILAAVEDADALNAFEEDYEESVRKIKERVEEIADAQCILRFEELTAEPRQELADGWKEYEAQKADAEKELADAKRSRDDAKKELDEGYAQLDKQEQNLRDMGMPENMITASLADARAKLDAGLAHMAQIIRSQLGKSVADLPGAGAAGGFGAGAVAFLNAVLRPGIEVVLDSVGFAHHLQSCDLVITGEGRIDGQSLGGKVPVGVARRAKGSGIPVIAIVGITGDGYEAVYDEGITAVFTTNRAALPFEQVKARSESDYRSTLHDILRLINAR